MKGSKNGGDVVSLVPVRSHAAEFWTNCRWEGKRGQANSNIKGITVVQYKPLKPDRDKKGLILQISLSWKETDFTTEFMFIQFKLTLLFNSKVSNNRPNRGLQGA